MQGIPVMLRLHLTLRSLQVSQAIVDRWWRLGVDFCWLVGILASDCRGSIWCLRSSEEAVAVAGIMMYQADTNLGRLLRLHAFRLEDMLPLWGTARHAENRSGLGNLGMSNYGTLHRAVLVLSLTAKVP